MTFLRIFLALVLAIWAGPVVAQTELREETYPPDVALAISAALTEMRGRDQASAVPVRISEEARRNLRESGFTYEGFDLTGSVLLNQENSPRFSDHIILSGVWSFSDIFDRKVRTAFALEYGMEGSSVSLRGAGLFPLDPPEVRTAFFVVPQGAMPFDAFSPTITHTDLLIAGLEKGIPWTPGAPLGGMPPSVQPYIVIAAVLDRLTSASRIQMTSGRSANDPGTSEGIRIVNTSGFIAAVARREIGESQPSTFRLAYTRGSRSIPASPVIQTFALPPTVNP